MRTGRLAVVGAAMLAGSGTWAQAPTHACALMSRDDFAALTGKVEYSEPTGMPWGGGSVCGFGNGQIILWTGPDAATAFDRFAAGFGQQDLPRTPVEGLGEGAFAIFYDPEDPYQDHGAGVVFGAGPPTVAVMVYAEEGEPPEAALPAAMAVAQAVAGRPE
jgi:hypothetical protein